MNSATRFWRRLLTVVILTVMLVPASLASAAGPPPGKGGGHSGGGETTAGNNLSVPVIFGDGKAYAPALRGTMGAPTLVNACLTDPEGDRWYCQQDADNTWQADNVESVAPLYVSEIDWGDNLEARDWRANSIVRIETSLRQNISATPMDGYVMRYMSGEGPSEMWATNGQPYSSNSAYDPLLQDRAWDFSGAGRLTIQKIDPDLASTLTWNPATGQWQGAGVLGTFFNRPVWETGDGPGYYNAEVNVSGKIVYGKVWDTRNEAAGAGEYRLTFSLDPDSVYPGTLNTFFDANTTIYQSPAEGEVIVEAEQAGNTAFIHPYTVAQPYSLTWIDVGLGTGRGYGGGGGQGGGGNGNGHGPGH